MEEDKMPKKIKDKLAVTWREWRRIECPKK
jgi:hypothetical protein